MTSIAEQKAISRRPLSPGDPLAGRRVRARLIDRSVTGILWGLASIVVGILVAFIIYTIVQGNLVAIKDFDITVDAAPTTTTATAVTVAPGGSIYTFPTAYHIPPFVVPGVISGTALYASAVNVTNTQVELHCWDNTGTDVGGLVNLTITGE